MGLGLGFGFGWASVGRDVCESCECSRFCVR